MACDTEKPKSVEFGKLPSVEFDAPFRRGSRWNFTHLGQLWLMSFCLSVIFVALLHWWVSPQPRRVDQGWSRGKVWGRHVWSSEHSNQVMQMRTSNGELWEFDYCLSHGDTRVRRLQ